MSLLLSTLILLCSSVSQAEVPFKPSDEFQIELEYKFKQRPPMDRLTMDFDETVAERDRKQYAGGPLPFLTINFKVLKLQSEEARVRAVNSDGNAVITRKAEEGDAFKIELGYTDDLKDRVTPHEFNIYFLTAKRKELTRVNLFVQEDGTFLVNGEIRGKF